MDNKDLLASLRIQGAYRPLSYLGFIDPDEILQVKYLGSTLSSRTKICGGSPGGNLVGRTYKYSGAAREFTILGRDWKDFDSPMFNFRRGPESESKVLPDIEGILLKVLDTFETQRAQLTQINGGPSETVTKLAICGAVMRTFKLNGETEHSD